MTERQKAREEKLENQCNILADVIISIRPSYTKANKQQKAFIETMVGAAIWYIPKPTNAWTGQVSVEALKAFHPESGHNNPRFSEEHVYPRKVAARLLLEHKSLTGPILKNLFCEKYGRLHYITPDENKAVQPFQRDSIFTNPEEAYIKAGVTLIQINNSDLRLIKKRDNKTIEHYLMLNGHRHPSS